MLSAADAALVQREPVLPGLPLLLDLDAFSSTLRQILPGLEIDAVRATYVRYKPRTSCLVAYRLVHNDGELDLYARAYPLAARGKLHKARQPPGGGGLGAGITVLEEQASVIYIFPHDRKLDSLVRLADAGQRRPLLAKLLPGRPELWRATIHRLRYKPERRYVAQLVSETGPQAVLKVYDATNYGPAAGRNKAFGNQGPLRFSQRLGRSNRHRILALEWVPGRPLNEAILSQDFKVSKVAAVGAALAELHAQQPKRLAHRSRQVEISTMVSTGAGIAAICPGLARPAFCLVRHMIADLRLAPGLSVPIHGDFSADQVLLASDGVTFLDVDEAARGDPAADLGTFIAKLEVEALSGALPYHRLARVVDELLDGYRLAAPGGLPDRIGLYVAAGLLRLAPHPFRNREPDWPAQTAAILERALEIVRDD